MKTIQYIIGVAMVVILAACTDEPIDDKAVLSNIDKGNIYVNQVNDVYNLLWNSPRIYTNHGNAVVSKYEVCVALSDGDDNMWGETERDYLPIMTTTQLEASVSHDMVETALGVTSGQHFLFAVRLPGDKLGGGVLCISEELNYHDKAHVWISASSSDESKGYVEGGEYCEKNAVVELNAIPYSGYTFVGWKEENKGDIFSTANPIRITADYDAKFVAVFE
ncbi:MAG: hypothetical protein IKZ99_12120 [Salinivirgaceae bacterium]|nr:hypothetical protein [Salinivirgaceae bacterium]